MSASKVFGGSDIDFSASLVPTPRYLLVLHDFEARSPDELTLKKGERVELLLDDTEFQDGWYHVSHGLYWIFYIKYIWLMLFRR